MFVIKDSYQRVPIKVWLDSADDLESGAYEQAMNLANLPFIHSHVALMPDTHSGYGMPIGGVIATEGVVIVNAVGKDIGCGMIFCQTDIKVRNIDKSQIEHLVGQIMRNIPTGFNHHKEQQESRVLNAEMNRLTQKFADKGLTKTEKIIYDEINRAYFQIGTLGGGNHFIELQEDDKGFLCIMIHSGSRNFGYQIANHFDKIAKELNEKWYSQVPLKYELAFLPTDSQEGQDYIRYMNLALDFAKENREKMLNVVQQEIFNIIPKVEFYNSLNVHHNYASLEHHFGKNVWVHRKGAVRVKEGELGIIPSAMGGYSYIVKGKGNKDTFNSCNHGAGRKMSRTKAEETFTTQEVMEDLNEKGVILGKVNRNKVADECIWAYKDIDKVMENARDMVEVVNRVKTIAVIKG